jgi:hypothetical protein
MLHFKEWLETQEDYLYEANLPWWKKLLMTGAVTAGQFGQTAAQPNFTPEEKPEIASVNKNAVSADDAFSMVVNIVKKHSQVPLEGNLHKGTIENFSPDDNKIVFKGTAINKNPNKVDEFKKDLKDDVLATMNLLTHGKGKDFKLNIKPAKAKYVLKHQDGPIFPLNLLQILLFNKERGILDYYTKDLPDGGILVMVKGKDDKEYKNFFDTDLFKDIQKKLKTGEIDDPANFTFDGSTTIPE